ncbi:AN1-type zinc finger protein 1-like isoform X1 [Anneissia japonica]|uniref:AN1-type zinc finger protein 1-like isoform X1 n=1 Tax=Anneissia japonica TaxID=1529436 RepID=UPI001425A2C6|nr:AN1-type zinc finger protein 1-like isoform X1 [Anneissia japonica]XP_033126058.1 AN1-type zinc finger protein 1-like isoform X1 [Anneissia japonica]
MAELHIGKHCDFPNCNQLDFLPFYCDNCSRTFCKEHRSKGSHECVQNTKVGGTVTGPSSASFSLYSCEQDDCKNKELTPVICEQCRKNFCLSHRHQQDHGCEKLVEKPDAMQKTAQLIQQIAESRESKPSKPRKKISTKAQKTAAKVALMKMKMHAVGETAVPQCERLYFQVYLPEEYRAKEKSKAMYFSKEWSVGRLVDKVASTVGLKNDNNLATSKKLRLFHPVVGVVYPMDQKLYELLDGEQCLFSGGDVIIEYVENDCTQLEDVDIYKL